MYGRCRVLFFFFFFFFNDTATTEIYTLSLHDALPFSPVSTAFCRPRPVSAVRSSGTIRTAQNSVIGAAGVGCSAGAPVRRGEPMDEPQSEPNPVRIPPLGLEG